MSLRTFLLIAEIQIALFAIGAILSFIKIKSKQQYIVLLGFALAASVTADFTVFFLHGMTRNYAASIYNMIAFSIISAIYYHAVGKQNKKVFTTLSVVFVLFALVNVLFIQRSSINSYTLIFQSIVIICYSLYYFYWLIRELPTAQLHLLPMFWINSAYILFFSGNLFLFVFTSYLVNVLNNDLLVYWTLHNVLGIIESVMIIVALWMDLRNITSHS
jgi:hypothetical protein